MNTPFDFPLRVMSPVSPNRPLTLRNRIDIALGIIIMLIVFPLPAEGNGKSDRLQELRELTISPDENELAGHAHEVFNQLVNHWDDIRTNPIFHVIDTDEGPWAFSLDTGEVMMTLSAVKISLGKDIEEGKSRLAFVLAHELAHWRFGDVWHSWFHRVRGGKNMSLDKFDEKGRRYVQEKETRADAEGLMHLAMAGYDPMSVVAGKRNFFSAWVESLTGISCNTLNTNLQQSLKEVCDEANRRVEYSLDQLQQVANHSLLFELGIQSYVANQYEWARDFFYEFGRNYPSLATQTNIGLSYLAETYSEYRRNQSFARTFPNKEVFQFVYPTVVASVEYKFNAALEWELHKRQQMRARRFMASYPHGDRAHYKQESISILDKVFDHSRDNQQTYIHLCISYLIWDNIPMAKGVLDGEYVPRFGDSPGSQFLRAMIAISEGDYDEATDLFMGLSRMEQDTLDGDIINSEMFLYAIAHNLNKLSQYTTGHEVPSERLSSHDLLDSRALVNNYTVPQVPFAVGKKVDNRVLLENAKHHKELRIDGRSLHAYEFKDGLNVVTDRYDIVIALWGNNGNVGAKSNMESTEISKVIRSSPDRQIATERGRYLAYDKLGLAYHVTPDGVDSWFYYPTLY